MSTSPSATAFVGFVGSDTPFTLLVVGKILPSLVETVIALPVGLVGFSECVDTADAVVVAPATVVLSLVVPLVKGNLLVVVVLEMQQQQQPVQQGQEQPVVV